MGALPRLKKKDELHYRKGSTNESRNCQFCENYMGNYCVGGICRVEARCKLMGIRESIRYRVRPDFTCDVQKYKKPEWISNGGENDKTTKTI
jgi:hypothetical protein